MDEVMRNYQKEYEEQYTKWVLGKISNTVWVTYCMDLLHSLMTQNEDVLKRLKECE